MIYVRMRLKVGIRREMKFKELFGGDKEPAVKAETETKWKPKVKGKAAAKRAKRKKRF